MAIQFFTFGTYYKKGSPAAGNNAYEVSRFVFQVKNKWWPGALALRHPFHPGLQQQWIQNVGQAHEYFVDMVEANIADIRYSLELGDDPLQFIPVPSSDVTHATLETARWSGRDVVRRLEARRLGRAVLSVVCRQPGISKEALGRDPTFDELVANYQVIAEPRRDARIVYFDDVITWGTHLGAMDHVLGEPQGSVALGVARTDGSTYDAFDRRVGQVEMADNGELTITAAYGDPADPYVEDPPSDDDPW